MRIRPRLSLRPKHITPGRQFISAYVISLSYWARILVLTPVLSSGPGMTHGITRLPLTTVQSTGTTWLILRSRLLEWYRSFTTYVFHDGLQVYFPAQSVHQDNQVQGTEPGWRLDEISFNRLYLVELRHRQEASWQPVISADL